MNTNTQAQGRADIRAAVIASVERMASEAIDALVADGVNRETAQALAPWIKVKAAMFLLDRLIGNAAPTTEAVH